MRGRRVITQAIHLASLELLLEDILDAMHHARVLRGDQRIGMAHRRGAARAPDAVHIVLGLHGHIIVHHVRDALHVYAARGNVGGHERARVAAPKRLEGGHALAL